MKATNTNSQRFLIQTIEKKELEKPFVLQTYGIINLPDHGKEISLTKEEKARIDADTFEIFAITENHFPDPNKAIKETREYNLRISILEIAESIGCIDAATDVLNDYSNGLTELNNYHRALAGIYYVTCKNAA